MKFSRLSLALVVLVTGCSAHKSNPLPFAAAQGTAQATFTITVPSKTASASAVKPQYISPATQSIAISVYDSTHTNLIKTANQNITTGAPGCTTPTPISPLTCAITIAIAPGSYAFDLTTFDGILDGSGNPQGSKLSANLAVPFTVIAGQANNISVTLGGIPSSVVLVPGPASTLSGNMGAGFTLGSCAGSQSVGVLSLDADANYILGPGAPTVSLVSDNPAKLAVAAAGPTAPNTFTITCPAMSPWGNLANLTAAAAPVSGTGTSIAQSSVGVSLYHAISGSITEFAGRNEPYAITAGPDGALWFTEHSGSFVGRITIGGSITEYPISGQSDGITTGPDGALWFTEGPKIGRITTTGALTEYPLPIGICGPLEIASGPDGALWFTASCSDTIGRITTAGSITGYALSRGANPYGIAAGPDGALWFTEYNGNKIGRITTAGTITEYALPSRGSGPEGITAGPDAALWFAEINSNVIGRITTAGIITEYAVPSTGGPSEITAGPDGALWYADELTTKIGRITTAGAISEYAIPGHPHGITTGQDGAIWFTEFAANKIGRLQ